MEIQFDKVSLNINGNPILSDISCCIPSGSFVAIIGENGAGKSSFLKCFHTHLHTISGTILADGINLQSMTRKNIAQNISAVMQDSPADLGMLVSDIVMMGRYPHLKSYQSPNHVDKAFVKTALKKVNLLSRINTPFANLSGGQKQRVQIARALTQTPQVLLLDEPTNHLDIRQQISILQLIKSMHITTIASIHDLNIVASYADYVICLEKGGILYAGTPETVLSAENIHHIYGVNTTIHSEKNVHSSHINIHYTQA